MKLKVFLRDAEALERELDGLNFMNHYLEITEAGPASSYPR